MDVEKLLEKKKGGKRKSHTGINVLIWTRTITVHTRTCHVGLQYYFIILAISAAYLVQVALIFNLHPLRWVLKNPDPAKYAAVHFHTLLCFYGVRILGSSSTRDLSYSRPHQCCVVVFPFKIHIRLFSTRTEKETKQEKQTLITAKGRVVYLHCSLSIIHPGWTKVRCGQLLSSLILRRSLLMDCLHLSL